MSFNVLDLNSNGNDETSIEGIHLFRDINTGMIRYIGVYAGDVTHSINHLVLTEDDKLAIGRGSFGGTYYKGQGVSSTLTGHVMGILTPTPFTNAECTSEIVTNLTHDEVLNIMLVRKHNQMRKKELFKQAS